MTFASFLYFRQNEYENEGKDMQKKKKGEN